MLSQFRSSNTYAQDLYHGADSSAADTAGTLRQAQGLRARSKLRISGQEQETPREIVAGMVQLVQLKQHPLKKVDTSCLIPTKVVWARHIFPAALAQLAQRFFAASAVRVAGGRAVRNTPAPKSRSHALHW